MDELLREFLAETGESLETVDVELVRFEQEPNNAAILANIFRLVHTIKGTCGFLGLPRLEALAHAAESLMGRFRGGMPVTADAVTLILRTVDRIKAILDELERYQREPEDIDGELIGQLLEMAEGTEAVPAAAIPQAPTPDRDDDAEDRRPAGSIRVGIETLEQLMTMVSELVLTRNQLLDLVRRHENSEFRVPLQRLSNVTAELQDGVMKTRMQPIGRSWRKLPRIVRDLSAELGKDIALEMLGADTELDRQMIDEIGDPLIHMVRNACDHGIEPPAERCAASKPAKGTIRLSAYHEGGHIVVRITDDGRGLDVGRIRARILAGGLASEAEIEAMSDAQVRRCIFEPGFSTASTITSVSGRGVGMDVVRSHLDRIGGTIEVQSVRGEGTSFTIKIPLTLAIVPALIVKSRGECFAVPQVAVVELVRVHGQPGHRIERIGEAALLRLRDRLLPLVDLGAVLQLDNEAPLSERGFVVVTQVGTQTFGILVDGVFHTEEIVVKPMASRLRRIAAFSGNTILGDGSVIMIVDPNGIAETIGMGARDAATRAQAQIDSESRDEAGDKVSLLVFRAGTPQPKAVPLSLVSRLEEIDVEAIEFSDGRHVVQYRGGLMPLAMANADVSLRTTGAQPILVFADAGRPFGLVVDEIVDIAEERLHIELAGDRPGVIGSAVVRGRATEIVDVGHVLPHAFGGRGEIGLAAPQRRPSLLLVDDSAFFRNMLSPVLKAAGYEVATAASGDEALAKLDSQPFDVLVADLEMPGTDGCALAAAVRARPEHAHTPMIALSAHSAPDAIARGRAAGFDDHVAKFDRQSLVAALKARADGGRGREVA